MEKLKLQTGEPPMGYSFVGIFSTAAQARKWHAAAMKVKDKKPYFLAKRAGHVVLFVKKQKGKGKMVGTGCPVRR